MNDLDFGALFAAAANEEEGQAVPVYQPTPLQGGGEVAGDPTGDALRAAAVAYWKMDEASGTREDSKGSNDLSDLNSVDAAAGKISNALVFNDAGDYARLTGNNLAFGDTSHSFAFWFRPSALPAGTDNTVFTQSDGAATYEYYLGLSDIGTVRFAVYTQTWTLYSTAIIAQDTTYFIVYEYDAGANEMRLYINNSLDVTETSVPPNSAVNGRFTVGREALTGADSFRGWVDEVLAKSGILTSAERAYLYNSGAGRSLY